MYSSLPRPTIFAHRGASAHAPENTLAAFELAVKMGADAIELDAKLCADGHVIVFHDASLERTTNGQGKVRELPLATLQSLDAGSWFGEAFRGHKIPTLAQVFEAVGQQTFINVELTNYASPRDNLPDRVVELVQQHGMTRRVLFSSFNPRALHRARQLLPEAPVGLLALPGFPGLWARSQLYGQRFPYQALHPERRDTTPALLARLHRQGRRLHSWTVNDPAELEQFFTWGVDGVFSDNVPLAQQIRAKAAA